MPRQPPADTGLRGPKPHPSCLAQGATGPAPAGPPFQVLRREGLADRWGGHTQLPASRRWLLGAGGAEEEEDFPEERSPLCIGGDVRSRKEGLLGVGSRRRQVAGGPGQLCIPLWRWVQTCGDTELSAVAQARAQVRGGDLESLSTPLGDQISAKCQPGDPQRAQGLSLSQSHNCV